jgi:uncharacterized cupredoxin-like copper-binding protein
MKVIVMFLQRRIENNKQQPIFLTKNNSSYKKLEKAMKEPVKEYDQIKKLVEITDENIIKKKTDMDASKNVKLLPSKKINIKK